MKKIKNIIETYFLQYILLHLLVIFLIVNFDNTSLINVFLSGVVALYILSEFLDELKKILVKANLKNIIIFAVLLVSLFTKAYVENVFPKYEIGVFIYLYCAYRLLANKEYDRYNVFYWSFLVCTFGYILFGAINRHSDILINGIDKNYTAIIVFLVFMMAWKKREIAGLLFGIIYALFFTASRSYYMLLFLFLLFNVFEKQLQCLYDTLKIKLFYIMLFLLISMIPFSYFWVFIVSKDGVGAYKQTLNDGSNRMRFVANVKAVEMLTEKDNMCLYGYGGKLLEVMNLNNDNHDTHPKYLGVRLVQTHNSILNLLVRLGIISGLIYIYILSKLLDKFSCRENLPYVLPWLINSMVMHSLLNNQYLLLWVIVLAMPITTNIKERYEEIK